VARSNLRDGLIGDDDTKGKTVVVVGGGGDGANVLVRSPAALVIVEGWHTNTTKCGDCPLALTLG
jgi:hypothetical protein